jgi:putative redox-active protein with C_GCAxxG_C_C motif
MSSYEMSVKENTKRVFLKKGSCSRTLFYILNREFGHPKQNEEPALDPLAGGIMKHGYQCGMLWGAAMAVGAESYRRNPDLNKAISMAITVTQHLMESFSKRTDSIDCEDITHADMTDKLSMAKYLITGKFLSCLNLANKWAPEAIQTAIEGLSHDNMELDTETVSCASELAKKMGANDEHMLMVAGFAGGLGLSGNACGALSAAIWMNTLVWCQNNPGKHAYPNPRATETLEAFFKQTDYEFLCENITGQRFHTISDHSEFIKCGGCDKLMEALVNA